MKTECVYVLVVLTLAVFAGTSYAALTAAEIKNPPTSIVVGTTATLTCEATGATTPTYTWDKNGATVVGETANTFTLDPKATDVGTAKIKCTATEGTDVQISPEVSIEVYAEVTAEVEASSSVAGVGSKITLTCKAGGGDNAYTYAWEVDTVAVTGATLTLERTSTKNVKEEIVCKVTSAGSSKKSSPISIWFTDMTVSVTGKTEAKVNEDVELTCSAVKGATGYTYTWTVDPSDATGTPNNDKYTVSSKKASNVKVTCAARDTSMAIVEDSLTIKFNGAPDFKLGLGISLPLVIAAVSALKLW